MNSPVTGPVATSVAALVAVSMLRVWARPRLPYDRWWKELVPYLSTQARQDLAGTDPTRVPALRVTGAAQEVATSNKVWARVRVPTSIGTFRVEVTRPRSDARWLVDRLDFPAGVH